MWRKHQSVYQDHLKYIRNDILKPLCVEIIRYCLFDLNEMFDLLHTFTTKITMLMVQFCMG